MVYSLITLYPSTETEFTTNGLGSLGEAVSCYVTEEANGGFELEMVYPIHGRRYKDLTNRQIIFAKPNPVDPPQPFRIYEISRPMNGLVTFYASHISYDLSGYPIKPFAAENALAAMSGLKINSVVNHPFEFWTDKNVTSNFKIDVPISTRGILAGMEGSILDVYKGEYKFDRFTVRLYTHRGANRGVVIRYGKNLTDLQQEENCSRVYTHVLPYWQSYEDGSLVELPEVILPTGGTYNFTNVYTLDLTYEFEEAPTVEQLRNRAQKYITDNELGIPKVSLDVSFAQLEQTEEYKHLTLLERVELFDTVTVEFPEMNVSSTAKISKTVYDVMNARYKSVTVGEIRSSISDTVAAQDGVIDKATGEVKSALQREVDNATKWITNGRGYMVAVKDAAGNWIEICSLDTPDIDKAVNVWRWNNGGFGHSSHGYNGPYSTAITQDGHIVADFITTGTLSAALMTAGVLQSNDGKTFYLDLEKGVLRMQADSLAIGGQTVGDIADASAATALKNQTQEDVFNKLTKNGTAKGIYMEGDQLYISFTYSKGGTLVLGGANNSHGVLEIQNASGNTVGRWNNAGLLATSTDGGRSLNLLNGRIAANYNNILNGYIGSNQWSGQAGITGITFDMEPQASYMSWARQLDGSGYVVAMLYANKDIKYGSGEYDVYEKDKLYVLTNLELRNELIFRNIYNGDRTRGFIRLFVNQMTFAIDSTDKINKQTIQFMCGNTLPLSMNQDRIIMYIPLNMYANLDMHGFQIINSSDERLKYNIEKSDVNALSVINSIKTYSFDWIETDEHVDLGFIAQQLDAEVDADFVDINEQDDHYSTKDLKMIPYLVKAIQELSQQVTDLKNEIIQLKGGSPVKVMSAPKKEWEPTQYTYEEKVKYAESLEPKKVEAETPEYEPFVVQYKNEEVK